MKEAILNVASAARFWPKVAITTPEGCWLWKARLRRDGYGQFTMAHHKPCEAHRAAWVLSGGIIPDGLSVLHNCDTPACCNPAHLRVGTHLDNMADVRIRGTRRGSKNNTSILIEKDIIQIRRRYRRGETQSELARSFNVSQSCVWLIVNQRSWTHVREGLAS